jgi:hypothetical protein
MNTTEEACDATSSLPIGETVLYTKRRFSNLTWTTPFTVVAYFPAAGPTPQYRIRSASEARDRIASEHELSRTPQPQRAFLRMNAGFFEDETTPEAANLNLAPRADLPRSTWHKGEPRRTSGDFHA